MVGTSVEAKGPKGGFGRCWLSLFPSLVWVSNPLLPTCLPPVSLEPNFPLLDSQTHLQPCFPGWKEGREDNVVVTVLATQRNMARIPGCGDYHSFSLSESYDDLVFMTLKFQMAQTKS